MRKYKCVKGFLINHVDDDGWAIENKHFEVKVGSVWERDETPYRFVAGKESVRLTDEKGNWIEIYSLNEHFVKMKTEGVEEVEHG